MLQLEKRPRVAVSTGSGVAFEASEFRNSNLEFLVTKKQNDPVSRRLEFFAK